MNKLFGIMLTFAIAVVSTILGYWMPLIGSAIFSILIGIILRNTVKISPSFEPGIKYSGKKILQYGIIVMGFTLSFNMVGAIGIKSLPITLVSISIALLGAFFIGKWLGVSEKLSTLIGVGTAICGGSAIAATSPIVKSNEEETAFSISTIFLFNIIAVFIFPFFGHLLGFSQYAFGFFAGAAINDTSSVVAASANYGSKALEYATVVKLTRALMIVPVCLLIAWLQIRKEKVKGNRTSIRSIFPMFILWFLVASLISTLFNFNENIINIFKFISTFMISIALAGIGLNVKLSTFKNTGLKPILLGLIIWFIVTVSTLVMMKLMNIN